MGKTICLALFLLGTAQLAGGAPKEVTNSLGMKLVRIEPGMFLMGAGFERYGVDDSAGLVKNVGLNLCDPTCFLVEVVKVFEKYSYVAVRIRPPVATRV